MSSHVQYAGNSSSQQAYPPECSSRQRCCKASTTRCQCASVHDYVQRVNA